MKKLFFTISLFCSVAANASCYCPSPIPPFHYATCIYLNSPASGSIPKIIIKGVKVEETEFAFQLKLLEAIYGEVNEDTLLFWKYETLFEYDGNTGIVCLTYLDQFSEGDTLILVAYRKNIPDLPSIQKSGFNIVGCLTNYLYYSNNIVTGYIDEGVSSMPYTDFVQMLQECLPTVGIVPQEETAAEIAVTCNPNPAQGNMLTVQFTLPFAAEIQVSIYDMHGRQVLNPVQYQYYNKGVHNLPIQLQQLPAQGIYFCRISAGNAAGICKIALLR